MLLSKFTALNDWQFLTLMCGHGENCQKRPNLVSKRPNIGQFLTLMCGMCHDGAADGVDCREYKTALHHRHVHSASLSPRAPGAPVPHRRFHSKARFSPVGCCAIRIAPVKNPQKVLDTLTYTY